MVDTAFVLAGGLGTRLRSVIPDVPKPMAAVAGRPFLEHLVDYLLTQGVEHIVLCVGHLRTVIQAHFGDLYRGIKISFSIEEEPKGTGGALSRALEDFQPETPFLVCNGDTFFPIDTSVLFDFAGEQSWAIATFRTNDVGRYGALSVQSDGTLRDLRVDSIEGPTDSPTAIHANSGVWIGNPGKLTLPLMVSETSYSLEDYLSQSLNRGIVTASACEFDALFIDIGVPADFIRAQTLATFLES